ncbi:MAG TPA: sulfur carrier protein ThiS [Solirubrobacteraceae bacterium]
MIVLNGARVDLPAGASLLAALAQIDIDEQSTGVAVAVDGEVVPRTHWEAYALRDGARVEALTAMQGG